MSILVALHHTTQYNYDRHVSLGPQLIRLRPAAHCQIPIESYSLKVNPKNHFVNWQQDPFNNFVAQIVLPEKTKEFNITVDLLVKIKATNPFAFFLEDNVKFFPFHYEQPLLQQLHPYFQVTENGPFFKEWQKQCDFSPQKTIDLLVSLNQRINQSISYIIRLEPGVQSCETTLSTQKGSCRDMAWLLCQMLRHVGLASRFCSGYLIQLKADEKPLDGPAGPPGDICDLHAWTEVYIPGAGWIGLDPTSGLLTGEGHIPVCATPDPLSAAPVSGLVDECESSMQFHMDIQRIIEEPRVTKPYFGREWHDINKLGLKVDKDLEKNDVRLTMGGEPTFISLDDKESTQWTVSALGDEKKQLSLELIKKLKNRFAKKGFIHHGQGKWYGGEPLPRWSLDCYWRVDNEPIWNDDNLLIANKTKNTLSDSKQFIITLAKVLGTNIDYILPAFEPQNVDNEKNNETGYVLPLIWSGITKGWVSQKWQFKPQNSLILLPGDSPIGLRLPLNQICNESGKTEEDLEIPFPHSSFNELSSLPSAEKFQKIINDRFKKPHTKNIIDAPISKALSVELRDQQICVFIPPLTRLEHYLELIAAIEWTAQYLHLSIILEGYSPPKDPRIQYFKITPDPGVIEVNIHPSQNWQELVDTIKTLYQDAKVTRLTTEKFLIDGRGVSTGGGNHITLGGPTPLESPFLRRPDLLQSLITFWQHHPSLSYLFSGLFIGPTSQAPRVDEARHESLYELEIAFSQITKAQKNDQQFYLIDRLLRNLLVDLTGNTHRAEFCIDKLFAPGSEAGRQGIVELRAFEMPPHPEMFLVQYLLVRALVAVFWKSPYQHRLIRWGTALHDNFMLPHCIWQDFLDVIEFLNHAGYSFDSKWFKPFFAFRFPLYGQVQVNDMELELRMALEPWHVLGEETQYGQTSRGVDSALERLQIKVNHFNPERYAITCNNHLLPLHKTAKNQQYIAGVRFKAWNATWTLHPSIPVHTPLVFDVIDRHYNRSIGGCTYYTSHPGGHNYETFPVNARDAESRIKARFEPIGHTPGPMSIPEKRVNYEYPYTLDLRCV